MLHICNDQIKVASKTFFIKSFLVRLHFISIMIQLAVDTVQSQVTINPCLILSRKKSILITISTTSSIPAETEISMRKKKKIKNNEKNISFYIIVFNSKPKPNSAKTECVDWSSNSFRFVQISFFSWHVCRQLPLGVFFLYILKTACSFDAISKRIIFFLSYSDAQMWEKSNSRVY